MDGEDLRLADVCPAAGKSGAAGARSRFNWKTASSSGILANSVEDTLDRRERREYWDLDCDLVRRTGSSPLRVSMTLATCDAASAMSVEISSNNSGSTIVRDSFERAVLERLALRSRASVTTLLIPSLLPTL